MASFFASYHHIISHSITSYIISHLWHELTTKSIFGKCSVKMKICQGTKPKNTTLSALLQKKGFLVYEAWMFLRSLEISTKHRSFSLRSMKRREGVFSPKAQKRYVYKVSCIAKKWITNNLHIRFKNMHIEYYSLITTKLHWSSKNVFTISTNPLSGPSPQLHLTTC
jgi:hypothetical protein